ncbi:MAG: M28 family peptidase [Capsulimonadaceae bacterium]|nr:M28 family peptidase [Capsulimonadaceae bacterium]
MRMSIAGFRLAVVLMLASALFAIGTSHAAPQSAAPAPVAAKLDAYTQNAQAQYRLLAKDVDARGLSSTITYLSALGSRVVGYPGNDKARDYVASRLGALLAPAGGAVRTEQFDATVPVDDNRSTIKVNGQSYRINPLWPNLVRTSTLPIGGIKGSLIYGGQGDLINFNGKQVAGSVVLMDFNSGTKWLNPARLGAKAILFAEPDEPMRGEAESKFVAVPVSIPRFWVSRRDAAALEAQALTTPHAVAAVDCNQPWRVAKATNIIGVLPGTDPVLRKQIVIVESYYDSMSVVPAIAPGAEAATGVASMLELARLFAQDRPKRTVVFVATDGHFLGLQGVREYIDKHVDQWLPLSGWDKFYAAHGGSLPHRQQVYLFTGLDLSSQSSQFGVFYKANYYNYREDIQSDFSDIGRSMRDNAAKIGTALGFDPTARFADGINPVGGKKWQDYLPGSFAFDAEAANLAGGKAIELATTDDNRQRVDTPADTPDNINIANVAEQTTLLACEYWHLFNDTNDPDSLPSGSKAGVMPVKDYPRWTRQGLRMGFSSLTGNALIFDPTSSFVPNKPIPTGALAVVRCPRKTFTGVRGNWIAQPEGTKFHFVGLPLLTANAGGFGSLVGGNQFHVDAYRISDGLPTPDDVLHATTPTTRGQIDFAPDLGPNGATQYPVELSMTGVTNSVQVIVFKCIPTTVFDLVDQSNLMTLTGIQIIDGATNGVPRQYGYALSTQSVQSSYVEDVAVLFTDLNTRIKVLMSSGPVATRFLLLNSRTMLEGGKDKIRAAAEGYGYNVANPKDPFNPPNFVVDGVVTDTPMRVASDMWTLDDFRIRQLRKYRIVDHEMDAIHNKAGELLTRAKQELDNLQYASFDSDSRSAWGLESRVYPRAQQTAADVVQGVLFYLFLMIPFAFFIERLFVAAPDLKKQLMWVMGIFLVIFMVFSQIHPAFDITINPGIVLIAFIMMALSLLVSLMVWGKFEDQMQQINKATTGVHKIDVGTAGVAFAAFSLGISNMRRRKARTVLTCITLVLLTFTVLSFTSIVNAIRYNKVAAPGSTRYHGILLRTANWDPLQAPAYTLLRDKFGSAYPVAARAWFQATTVKSGDKVLDIKGVTGFQPTEATITHPQEDLIAGRWFQPGDVYTTILPDGLATSLGLTTEDVGKASVTFSGQDYLVIGIIDGSKLKDTKDLDNEPLSPADFQATQASASANANGSGGDQAGFQEYLHIDPQQVIYVPYETLMNIGGKLESVAVNFKSPVLAEKELMDLMPRLDLNLYAGLDKNYRFSAINSTAGKDMGTVVVPLLIAALIVLNTMLGSVFERVKEIAIFSSIGLTPGNIAMLFIAESLVYAVIGAVSGYLIGQGLSKIITTFGILPGLYLNFSSTSAMLATASVGAVVLLSTLYPARKASEVATPAVDRVWRLPEPDGDEWSISLPFAITGNQAVGINGYLAEWLQSYVEQSVGDFLVQDVEVSTCQSEFGEKWELKARVWLAPFDLGVSQTINLQTVPTALEDVFEVRIDLHRLSGDVSNWKRVNRRFLNVVRRQFLIWRTLSAEQRERYFSATHSADGAGQASELAPAL